MAPMSPQSKTQSRHLSSICLMSTRSPAMVWATRVPNSAKATKLKNAAQMTATPGESTRVDTTVAIELAASCQPFATSKMSATAMMSVIKASAVVMHPEQKKTGHRAFAAMIPGCRLSYSATKFYNFGFDPNLVTRVYYLRNYPEALIFKMCAAYGKTLILNS